MVSSYSLILNKQAELKQFLFNPFLFSGITGHLLISKIFDQSTKSYVNLSQAKEPDLSKYQVFIVYDHETTEFNRGIMIVYPKFSGIIYHIETFDNTLNGDFEILVQDKKLLFIDNIKVKKSIFGGRSYSELTKHIINDHIKTFLSSLGLDVVVE